MVSPWMENGSIIDFLREDLEANPLELVHTAMFCPVPLSTESCHSWRMPHAVFSIFTTWISLMAT